MYLIIGIMLGLVIAVLALLLIGASMLLVEANEKIRVLENELKNKGNPTT